MRAPFLSIAENRMRVGAFPAFDAALRQGGERLANSPR